MYVSPLYSDAPTNPFSTACQYILSVLRNSFDQIFVLSSVKLILGTALIFATITTIVLLIRMCARRRLRSLATTSEETDEDRLSMSSVQAAVAEKLQDAPPKYSSLSMSMTYQNKGFKHDNTPPPPYSGVKHQNDVNSTLHL